MPIQADPEVVQPPVSPAPERTEASGSPREPDVSLASSRVEPDVSRVAEEERIPRKGGRLQHDPRWAKIVLIIGCVVMVASGIAAVVPKLLAAWVTQDIAKEDFIPPELIGENIDGAINLLLLGMDQRASNTTEPIRADTIIIAHIPKTHDRVYLISLPRDAEVDIPDFPETEFGGWRTKINAAFAAGARKDGKPDPSPEGRQRGAKLTMMTISDLVPGGLKFNGAAIINFEGFRDVLTAIDGVDMCVDVETRSIHYDKNNVYHTMIYDVGKRKVYPEGCYHMDAVSALDYARQRHVENADYTRQRHQQQLLLAIFRKIVSKDTLTDLGTIRELQKAAGGLLTLDVGKTAVEDWAFTLRAVRADDVVMVKTNGGLPNTLPNGNERLTTESMSLLRAVHEDKVSDFLTDHPDWMAKDK
jgi:anionic cell wall polymer biosynthesis LytR-Cps2A-Psr (LCP) family protein